MFVLMRLSLLIVLLFFKQKEKDEKNGGIKASESTEIKLYAQYPPIEKMDASLSTLTNCE